MELETKQCKAENIKGTLKRRLPFSGTNLQSFSRCPLPLQRVQHIWLTMLVFSGHCQLRCSTEPQFEQNRLLNASFSLSVPFSRANSRSWVLRRLFWFSGSSIAWRMIFMICLVAAAIESSVGAVRNACNGSSGSGCPSFRPSFPSFMDPFPLIMILAPVCESEYQESDCVGSNLVN